MHNVLFPPNKKLAQCVGKGPTDTVETWTRPWSPAALTVGAQSQLKGSRVSSKMALKHLGYITCTKNLADEKASND